MQNEEAFIVYARSRGEALGLSGEEIDRALPVWERLERRGYRTQDVTPFLELASAIENGIPTPSSDSQISPAPASSEDEMDWTFDTPAAELGFRRALGKWEPAIRKIRMSVFGVTAAPFGTAKEAHDWVRGELDSQGTASEADEQKAAEIFEAILGLVRQYNNLNISASIPAVDFVPQEYTLMHPESGEPIALRNQTKIAHVAKLARRIAVRLRFSDEEAFHYVLVGRSRPRSAVFVDVVNVGHPAVEILLRSPLSYKDFRTLHSWVRSKWPRTQLAEARLSRTQVALLELVEGLGGPPSPYAKDFWEDVAREHERRRMKGSRDWRLLAERYQTVQKRLNVAAEALN